MSGDRRSLRADSFPEGLRARLAGAPATPGAWMDSIRGSGGCGCGAKSPENPMLHLARLGHSGSSALFGASKPCAKMAPWEAEAKTTTGGLP